jgi:hypothetical protein
VQNESILVGGKAKKQWTIQYVLYFVNSIFGKMEVLKGCALIRSFIVEHMMNLEVLMGFKPCHVL